ncbi:uncharacterized protein LOC121376818 [Gigantopelta aegis]|uniref:uncharacterized protein LOC121376818 n=1 Tax=Gigantopelta aegis TaxID=1735272 RepID=UPI001B88C573|nr:uncharacterized protein LOC121376818 [Gigantopelta aegis]
MVANFYFVLMAVDLFIICGSNLAINIARDKPTVMSSTYSTYVSSFAVDGKTGTNAYIDGCTHTKIPASKSWWMVDLQGTYNVHTVTITNRDRFPERLHSFVIEIFSQNPQGCSRTGSVVCWNYTGAELPTGKSTFTCDGPTRGRFVRIRKWKVKHSQDVLSLCEVQIYSYEENGCDNFKYFWRQLGTRLLSQHSEQLNDTSLMECLTTCERETGCLAFNINVSIEQCQLIASGSFNDIKEISPDWDYYGMDFC